MNVKSLPKENSSFPASFTGKWNMLLFGNGTKLLVQLIIIFVYARTLAVAEYGCYQFAWMFINFFSVITLFGLPTLLLSSPAGAVQQVFKQYRKLIIFLFGFLYALPVLFLLWKVNPLTFTEKGLLMVWLLFQNAAQLAEVRAIRTNRLKQLLWVNVSTQLLWLAAHLVLLFFGYALPLLLILLSLISLQKAFLLWGKNENAVTTSARTGAQWFYLAVVDVLGVTLRWLDKWVILAFASLTAFAMYSNGAYEIPVFALLVSTAGSIMTVEMSRNTSPALVPAFFKKSFNLLSTLVFPAFAYLICFHENIFLLLFSEKYAAAIPVFLVSLLVLPIRINHYTAALQVAQRGDIILKGAVYDLILAIVLMWWLYPHLGARGLALAMVCSTWLQAAYYLYQTARITKKRVMAFIPIRYLVVLMAISLLFMYAVRLLTQNLQGNIALLWGTIAYLMLALILLVSRWKNWLKLRG